MEWEQAAKELALPQRQAYEQARGRWDSIAKPLHGLGLLEDMVCRIAAARGRACPIEIRQPCAAVFCADNGVVREGVAQTGQEVTAIVACNLAEGNASVCKMAQIAGVRVIPVDVGLATPVQAEGLWQYVVARGTQNMAQQPAMSREQAHNAIQAGFQVAQRMVEQGCDLLLTGEMGIGNTTTSSAVASLLLHKSVSDVTGRGAGLSQEGVRHKISVIRRAIALNHPDSTDVLDILSKVGGFDLAALTGFCIGGAFYKTPILLDGLISTVAALAAVRLCTAVKGYLLASHQSNEPAARLLLEALGLSPVIIADMHLGEGTGAVAAVPLLSMACAVYNGMSTFSDIQVAPYRPFL